MITIHTNVSVTIVLTKQGVDILNNYYQQLNLSEDLRPMHTAGQPFDIQLWRLAYIFGPYMYNGSTVVPFEGNEFALNEFSDQVTSPYKEPKYFLCTFLGLISDSKFTAEDKADAQRKADIYVQKQNKGEAKSDRIHIKGLKEITFQEFNASKAVTHMIK